MIRRSVASFCFRAVSFVSLAALVGACLDLGNVEDTQGGGGVGGVGGGTGGSGGCDCIPNVPISWGGPVALYLGTEPILPACPTGYPSSAEVRRGGSLDAPPAQCPPCTCGPATGLCDPPTVNLYSLLTTNCGFSPSGKKLTSGCSDAWIPAPGDSVKAGAAALGSGSCQPSAGIPTISPAHWTQGAHLCSGSAISGECSASGQICVPKIDAPFSSTHCVYQAGDVACPSAYPSKSLLHGESIEDSRACSACACGASTCDATTVAFAKAKCTGASVEVPNDGNCTHAPFTIGSLQVSVGVNGACVPSGGVPTGEATGSDPLTVCCLL